MSPGVAETPGDSFIARRVQPVALANLPTNAAAVAAALLFAAISTAVAAVAVALATAVAADLIVAALAIPVAVAATAVAARLTCWAVGRGTTAIAGRLVLTAVIAADLVVAVAVDVPAARVSAVGDTHANTAAAAQARIAVRAVATRLTARRPLYADLGGGASGDADAQQPGDEAFQGIAPAALSAKAARQCVERFVVHIGVLSFASGHFLWSIDHS